MRLRIVCRSPSKPSDDVEHLNQVIFRFKCALVLCINIFGSWVESSLRRKENAKIIRNCKEVLEKVLGRQKAKLIKKKKKLCVQIIIVNKFIERNHMPRTNETSFEEIKLVTIENEIKMFNSLCNNLSCGQLKPRRVPQTTLWNQIRWKNFCDFYFVSCLVE